MRSPPKKTTPSASTSASERVAGLAGALPLLVGQQTNAEREFRDDKPEYRPDNPAILRDQRLGRDHDRRMDRSDNEAGKNHGRLLATGTVAPQRNEHQPQQRMHDGERRHTEALERLASPT